jgi:hypothetical protein
LAVAPIGSPTVSPFLSRLRRFDPRDAPLTNHVTYT